MSAGLIAVLVILAVVIIVLLWGVSIYNGLVALRNRVGNGWAQIDVQLKQRTDLVPNLVATVKGYAAHESGVFEEVTKARAAAVDAAGNQQMNAADRAAVEAALSKALVNLRATAEAYPELKANQNFMDLQQQLSALEQKIAYARQFYNDVVQKFNTKIQTVPSNIIASMFHFTPAQYFAAAESDKQVPQVRF